MELQKALLFAGESKYLEYKKTVTKTLLKTVSAFANYHDGMIVIGIDDERNVIGVSDAKATRLVLENMINDSVMPMPSYEFEVIPTGEKEVVVLKVHQGDHTPYTVDSKAYKRSDTSTIAVDRFAFNELILFGRNIQFEDLTCDAKDLTFDLFGKLCREKIGIHSITDDVLRSFSLLTNSGYTNAAALISDKNPLINSGLSLIRFDGKAVLQMKDVVRMNQASVLSQYEACMAFYGKHISRGERITGAYHTIHEEIPFVSYREAVANAIVHRDYARPGEVRIEIFDDRVAVLSSGGLPVGISTEEYLAGKVSVPRNRILAEVFLRLGIVERLATGIRRIREYYAGSIEQPIFDVSENSICVILPSRRTGNAIVPVINQPADLSLLSKKEQQVFRLIQKNRSITRKQVEDALFIGKTQSYSLLNSMVVRRIIVRIGTGKTTEYRIID